LKKSLPILFLFFGLWFCIRWISIALGSDAFQADPDSYRMLATELATTAVFGANSLPTAFRPPLYPWVLSFGVNDSQALDMTFIKLLHSTLGALTCFFVYCTTLAAQNLLWNRCEVLNRGKQMVAPALAATLVAIDPILVRQSQLIMTETLATFLSAITLWCMLIAFKEPGPVKFLIVGIGIGLSVLCRPTAVVWGGLFIVTFLIRCFFEKSPTKLLRGRIAWSLASFALGVFAFVFPWAARNHLELNRWIFTTTHGGYTLLLANNNSLYDHFEKTLGRDWNDTSFQADWLSKTGGLNELEQDRIANSMAREAILQRPFLFLKSCLIRLGWLWAPWPNQSNWVVSTVIGIWYALVYLAAILGGTIAWRNHEGFFRNPLLVPAVCLILSLSMVHAVYWSNLRMRSVAMPALYMLASIPISLKMSSSSKFRESLA